MLRLLGFGPKKAELLKATVVCTTYRLKPPPMTWAAYRTQASSGLEELAASTGTPGPQVIAQMASEHEGVHYILAAHGAVANAAPGASAKYASAMAACALPDSLVTTSYSGWVWAWAKPTRGLSDVTLTSTSFDIKEGAFEDFVTQFGAESHQIRQHAEECGILWQATFPSAAGKVTLLSTFKKDVDGPKRMGPRLPELYAKMGLSKFLTAQPMIDTSAHGSFLKPIATDAIAVSA